MLLVKVFIMVMSAATANATTDLEAALGREKTYLQQQAEALKDLRGQLKKDSAQRIKNLEKDVLILQKELSSLQIANKEAQGRVDDLKSTLQSHGKSAEQAQKSWDLFQRSVFNIRQVQFFTTHDFGAQALDMSKMENRLTVTEQALESLLASTEVYEFNASYLNDGALEQGKVRRYGLIGAEVVDAAQTRILGPSKETLPEVKLTSLDLQGDRGFLYFTSLNGGKDIKLHSSLTDRVAHSLPAVFLGFVFILVLGLFGLFVRE